MISFICLRKIIPILQYFFRKHSIKEYFPSFCESGITLISKPDEDSITEENYRSKFLINMGIKILKKILANKINNV